MATSTSSINRLTTKPKASPSSLVRMDRLLTQVLHDFEGQDYWEFFTNPNTSDQLIVAVARELMLEVWSYQKCVNESILFAIGEKGRLINEQPLVQAMLAVQLAESDQVAIPLEDYATLGGDKQTVSIHEVSPAALVLMAAAKYLAEQADPLRCLGYMYFLEKFAKLTIQKIEPVLTRVGYPRQRLGFLQSSTIHSSNGVSLLSDVIASYEENYENAAESIAYGFNCFSLVYPIPIWQTAYHRALKE